MGLPRTVGDFVCILSVIAIEFLSRTSSKELPSKAAIALNPPCSKAHSTHAPTLHACAVVELRFMTERKKKKTISWKPLRFTSWFPTLISCSPNFPTRKPFYISSILKNCSEHDLIMLSLILSAWL